MSQNSFNFQINLSIFFWRHPVFIFKGNKPNHYLNTKRIQALICNFVIENREQNKGNWQFAGVHCKYNWYVPLFTNTNICPFELQVLRDTMILIAGIVLLDPQGALIKIYTFIDIWHYHSNLFTVSTLVQEILVILKTSR